ncbi:MAG: hypothetical protein ACI9MR_000536 [Myxococcota bacterium]|jgi:hypothetical protein
MVSTAVSLLLTTIAFDGALLLLPRFLILTLLIRPVKSAAWALPTSSEPLSAAKGAATVETLAMCAAAKRPTLRARVSESRRNMGRLPTADIVVSDPVGGLILGAV